ncbi:MAG: hypothetical protein Q8K81_06565, partial [Sulfuricurvum sp.]|nr:hypothetical protein [Sulfuricurvum sp.]
MINAFCEHRQHFQKQLIQEVADYHYRFSRYHATYSIALVFTSEVDVDFSVFSQHLRASDKQIFLQTNLCAIIFDGTNEEQGIKAANNLLSHVQNIFFTKHLYMAVVTATTNSTQFQTVHDLFDLIAYALNHNLD